MNFVELRNDWLAQVKQNIGQISAVSRVRCWIRLVFPNGGREIARGGGGGGVGGGVGGGGLPTERGGDALRLF